MPNKCAHIIITSKVAEDSCEITSCYAVTPELERAWEFWLAGQATAPSYEAIRAWFGKSEVELDRADGPAVVMSFSDGSRIEEWWVDGNVHRVGAPAVLEINADGSRKEVWFTNDKIDRADGPAIVARGHDGTILSEQWYHDDVLEKSRGPTSRSPAQPPSSPAP